MQRGVKKDKELSRQQKEEENVQRKANDNHLLSLKLSVNKMDARYMKMG
jgi:hypothetical protein